MKTNIASQIFDFFTAESEKIRRIDMDNHISPGVSLKKDKIDGYYHGKAISAEEIISEMDMAGVDMALVWQNPSATKYKENDPQYNYESLINAVEYLVDSAIKYPGRFLPTGWIDPKATGVANAKKMIDYYVDHFGLFIIKINPAQNRYPMDDPGIFELLDYMKERNVVTASHYGADTPFTTPEQLENLLTHLDGYPFIAIHAGGGGASFVDQETHAEPTRYLFKKYSNLYGIESAKRELHIETDFLRLIRDGGASHMFLATDAPYNRMYSAWASYNAIFDAVNHMKVIQKQPIVTEQHRAMFYRDNAINFVKERTSQFLAKNS